MFKVRHFKLKISQFINRHQKPNPKSKYYSKEILLPSSRIKKNILWTSSATFFSSLNKNRYRLRIKQDRKHTHFWAFTNKRSWKSKAYRLYDTVMQSKGLNKTITVRFLIPAESIVSWWQWPGLKVQSLTWPKRSLTLALRSLTLALRSWFEKWRIVFIYSRIKDHLLLVKWSNV